jgi:phosphatidylglycerophosphatase A
VIDTEPFTVVKATDTEATFAKPFSLTNRNGTLLKGDIRRSVRLLDDATAALVIAAAAWLGWWACTRTARDLGIADPPAIVWDEVVAFWLVLWVVLPAGFAAQAAAFVLFRFFDAVKPGPVGWADRAFKGRRGEPIGWRQGFGILFDDLVAAGCTLLVYALSVAVWRGVVA